ncbi:hypothetical protein AN958_10068 [Leucoagaricus sp. SymC.cos]|nr:hypothetical protein AN958_10068 [Leucoagaricus sp. SymC.cos]
MVNQQAIVKALINSGYTHTCISEDKVKKLGILIKPVNKSFKVFNADGTPSGHKQITHYANITFDTHGHKEQVEAVITILNLADMFLEHD